MELQVLYYTLRQKGKKVKMEEIGIGFFQLLVELAGIRELSEIITKLESFDETTRNVMSIIGVLVCIVGLLQCFLGYKLFRVWCGFVGFFLGTLFAIALATSGILSSAPESAKGLISALLIIFLGLTGAMIAYKAYLVGLFIYAFHAVFFIGFILLALITGSLLAGLVAGILIGTAMGVLAVIYRRFWLILMTSISGGISVCTGLMMVMQTTDLSFAFFLPPVLAIAGFFVQYITDKKEVGKPVKAAATAAAPPAAGETPAQDEATGADTDAAAETAEPPQDETASQEEAAPQTEEVPAQVETPPQTEAPPADDA